MDKTFVVVVPSFNNAAWYERNLGSILSQRYDRYSVLYVDDASPDGTGQLVGGYLDRHDPERRVTLVTNPRRMKGLANVYHAVRACPPDSVIVLVDGDDALAHDRVLLRLNEVYQDPAIWMTYGQFRWSPDAALGFAAPIPEDVIAENRFREYPFVASHLHTFYAGLFQKIRREDLLHAGEFFDTAWDLAVMFPLLEMAGRHSRFIPEVLYLYNAENPLNDHHVDPARQVRTAELIRAQPRYRPILDYRFARRTRVFVTAGQWGRLFAPPDPVRDPDDRRRPLRELRRACDHLGYELIEVDSLADVADPDCVVAFDVPVYELHALEKYPRERCLLFLWEPPAVLPENYDPAHHRQFARVYTWRDDLVDGARYLSLRYPVLRPMIDRPRPFAERKLCTMIASCKGSSHPDELYSERRRVIEFFEAVGGDDFEFYGWGWPAGAYRTYRGVAGRKVDCLARYRFCVCYENCGGLPGYVTEKIFDCFSAACVPIYRGASNIEAHVPRECFIARDDFAGEAELYDFLRAMPEARYARYLDAIRAYLASEAAAEFSTERFLRLFVNALASATGGSAAGTGRR